MPHHSPRAPAGLIGWRSRLARAERRLRGGPLDTGELASATLATIVTGRITRCGRPAVGSRVVCWRVTQIGLPGDIKPCEVSWPTSARVGEDIVGSDGGFSIAVDVFKPEDACFFSAKAWVEVYDGATRVWRSEQRPLAPTVRFDHELVPECGEGGSVIRVIDESGGTVRSAEVFVNGRLRGRTDDAGNLVVSEGLDQDDLLVARRAMHQTATPRDWIYRVYVTSLRVRHDANGGSVELRQQRVSDPTEVQVLRLERRNALVGFNLHASIEWDATRLDFERYRDRLYDLGELLYNATDGQMLVEQVTISDDGLYWDQADVRIYANLNQSSVASVDGLFRETGWIRMNPNDAYFVGSLLHELGHYAFGVLDEYEDAPGPSDPSDGPPCTLASDGTTAPFGNGFGKDSCFMRGARDGVDGRNQKKLCSMHPANPHAPGTEQGPVDCWSEVINRYGDSSKWRLLTPVSRNAIVDRLPDSGEPLRGAQPPPGNHQRPRSFIPVLDWKTRASEIPRDHSGLCQDLTVRARFEGGVVEGARVWLSTAQGRSVYQGWTKVARPYDLAYGVRTDPGEIPIRGAHIGDLLRVFLPLGGLAYARGEVRVTGCDRTLVVDLERVEIDPDELMAWAARPADPPRTVVRAVWPEERKAIASVDGRLRLVLQDGSIRQSDALSLEERPDLVAPLPAEYHVVSGPYQAALASGNALGRPVVLRFGVPEHEAVDPHSLEVRARDADGDWSLLPCTVITEPLVVTATTEQLGAWLLLHRAHRAVGSTRGT